MVRSPHASSPAARRDAGAGLRGGQVSAQSPGTAASSHTTKIVPASQAIDRFGRRPLLFFNAPRHGRYVRRFRIARGPLARGVTKIRPPYRQSDAHFRILRRARLWRTCNTRKRARSFPGSAWERTACEALPRESGIRRARRKSPDPAAELTEGLRVSAQGRRPSVDGFRRGQETRAERGCRGTAGGACRAVCSQAEPGNKNHVSLRALAGSV
jgi:hypothetical protein